MDQLGEDEEAPGPASPMPAPKPRRQASIAAPPVPAKPKQQRRRAGSFPLDRKQQLVLAYGQSTNIIKDSVGRNHAFVSALGPATLYLRSVKFNPVTIATHVSDWERMVQAYLTSHPRAFAVDTCGDGCQDLTCSRVPNMICHFDAFLKLTKEFPRVFFAQFGQYAPDDSPMNAIERMWAAESKKLRGLLLSAFADGDSVPPSLLRVSPEEKKKKYVEVLEKAMSSVKERLVSTPSLKGIESKYESVPLASEGDLHDYYAEIMDFQYATRKTIASTPALAKLLKTYRVMCAHTDRRRLSMGIVTHIPHLVKPEEFGTVEDCELCSKIQLTKRSKAFLDVLIRNGGFMFSPSKDPDDETQRRYRTCMQELSRLKLGITGSKPDELLPTKDIAHAQRFDESKDRRIQDELYPAYTSCPHRGCWQWGFTSIADSKRHESLAHPGQRAQRLQDKNR